MPRPERPIDPDSGPLHVFAAELRLLRSRAGSPKYLAMARQTGRSRTALAEAAGGDHLPTWETTEAYVKACGGDVAYWRAKWEAVRSELQIVNSDEVVRRQEVSAASEECSHEALEDISRHPLKERSEVLLRMWQEQRTQARQSENQRALMTVVIAIVALWLATYSAMNQGFISSLAAVGLTLLGLFGALLSGKYYERFKMHMDAAQAIRHRISEFWPELFLEHDWLRNRTQHKRAYSKLYEIPLHRLWIVMHLSISATGLVVLALKLSS